MMNLTNFTQTIERGMNNPDCAFFIGSTAGQWTAFKYFIAIAVMVVVFKLIGNITQLSWDLAVRRIKADIKKWRDRNATDKQ